MRRDDIYVELRLLVLLLRREFGIATSNARALIDAGAAGLTFDDGADGERHFSATWRGRTARVARRALGSGDEICCGAECGACPIQGRQVRVVCGGPSV